MDLVLGNARRVLATLGLILLVLLPWRAQAQGPITVASTTSTEQSGLFKHLVPKFTGSTGIQVRVVAVGTGQALDIGRRGDADVVFVHDKEAEVKFVAEGFGVTRQDVMYNDFIVVGPKSDPAGAAGRDVQEALRRIAAAKAPFISRGDRSGTHAAELRFWRDAGLDLAAAKGDWYKEIGQGMGPALNTASAANAYVLSDRATWLAFKNRGDLAILVEGDQRLFNQYGVMLVSPARHPQVKVAEGQAFIDWLVSGEGQKTIAEYKIDGGQLFFPNASKAGGHKSSGSAPERWSGLGSPRPLHGRDGLLAAGHTASRLKVKVSLTTDLLRPSARAGHDDRPASLDDAFAHLSRSPARAGHHHRPASLDDAFAHLSRSPARAGHHHRPAPNLPVRPDATARPCATTRTEPSPAHTPAKATALDRLNRLMRERARQIRAEAERAGMG